MNTDGRELELNIAALTENLQPVLDFVDAALEEADCPVKTQMQLDVADGSAIITFFDRGIPYDPLAKEDPDVTLAASERPIGGLGIYMTKKMMDDVIYEHKDGCNVLKLVKKL